MRIDNKEQIIGKKVKTHYGTPVTILHYLGCDCYLVEVEGRNSNGVTVVAKSGLVMEEKD